MSKTISVATIVGARPQFVKAAAVSRALRKRSDVAETLIHTGQHYDENMSDVFFTELELEPPRHNLGVSGGGHGQQTGRMLEAIEEVLLGLQPDWVLLYGDTNSTLAGALAAAKLHLPVAHVEAGLRSFNRRMPEEINRVLTDHLSSLLLVPTEAARRNLELEGISDQRVHLVGDVMYDAALHYGARAERESTILERLGLRPQTYILATVHRAENTDVPARLTAIADALKRLAADMPVVLPLHPRTAGVLQRAGNDLTGVPGLHIIEPVGYLDMVMLEKNARLVATDSGGVQKEAYFYRVPCVTLRDETEWVELIETGWNRLAVPDSAGRVFDLIQDALDSKGQEIDLYGDGRTAERIGELLCVPPAGAEISS